MGNSQSYVERKEDAQDLSPYGSPFGGANTARPMIEIAETNRILTSPGQAIALILIKGIGECNLAQTHDEDAKQFIRTHFHGFRGENETAQLTIDSMSREDYLRALSSNKQAKKGLFSSLFGRKRSSVPEDADSGEDSD